MKRLALLTATGRNKTPALDRLMPELPDVEAFKSVLSKGALHKEISRVVVTDHRILGALPVKTFAGRLAGATLVASRRHGKHLLARIDRGGWLTLHFGLTGALALLRRRAKSRPLRACGSTSAPTVVSHT